MAIYLQDGTGAVIIRDGMIGTTEDCCCEDDFGACCDYIHGCGMSSRTECEGADPPGTFLGGGTTCEEVGSACYGACCHSGTCADGLVGSECQEETDFWWGLETSCDIIGDGCCTGCETVTGMCAGAEEGGACFCTVTETYSDSCSVIIDPGGEGEGEYGRTMNATYTTTYGWFDLESGCVSGIVDSTCTCTLVRHFADGSSTSCDCCGPCTAGFCSDVTGGVSCTCELEPPDVLNQSCDDSFDGDPPYSPHCTISHDISWS